VNRLFLVIGCGSNRRLEEQQDNERGVRAHGGPSLAPAAIRTGSQQLDGFGGMRSTGARGRRSFLWVHGEVGVDELVNLIFDTLPDTADLNATNGANL
jgi:hypothetical protein